MKYFRAAAALRKKRAHDESGFTLAELIVSIAIEAIIFGALATAFVVLLNGSTSVNDNLARSNDARFAANYIISDARNSSGPEISLIDTASCPDPNAPVAGTPTPVVLFGWNSLSSAGATTANLSNYLLVSNTLLRRHCEGGVLVGAQVLASNIASVTVSCTPVAYCSGDPKSITVTITATAETVVNPGAPVPPPYSYTLTAAFRHRQSDGTALKPSAPQSLVVFGGGCGVSVTAASLRVYGNAFINMVDAGACHALALQSSGTMAAGGVSILTGGTCVAATGTTCPPISNYSPAINDPYASLAAPTTAGRPSQTGCSGSAATQTASPGVYASAFILSGGGTCTLASGIYIMQAGFAVANGATLKTAAGGVMIYVTGGSFQIGGDANVALTAMSTGAYAGMAVWQAAADTSTLQFSNDLQGQFAGSGNYSGTGGTIVINGTLYAPKATLNVSGSGVTRTVTSLAVLTLTQSSGGNLVVGSASAVPLSIGVAPATSAWTVNRAFPTTAMVPAGGDGNYTVTVTGLPAGMSFNPATLIVSGTPTAGGATTATITLKDGLGDTFAPQAYPITVNPAPAITTVSPLPTAEVTDPYLAGISTSGGTTPFIWSQAGLPAGLTMNSTTGAITGTPTASGAFTVVVTLTDAAGASVNQSFSLAVTPAPTITTASLPSGEKSLAYTATVAGSSGTTPYTWSQTGLPNGLTLAANTGVISGTPNGTAGTASVTITLTDAMGAVVTKSLTLVIVDQPNVVSIALTNGTGTAGTIDTGDKITIVYSAR